MGWASTFRLRCLSRVHRGGEQGTGGCPGSKLSSYAQPGTLESENWLPIPKRKSEFRMRKSWTLGERPSSMTQGSRGQHLQCGHIFGDGTLTLCY